MGIEGGPSDAVGQSLNKTTQGRVNPSCPHRYGNFTDIGLTTRPPTRKLSGAAAACVSDFSSRNIDAGAVSRKEYAGCRRSSQLAAAEVLLPVTFEVGLRLGKENVTAPPLTLHLPRGRWGSRVVQAMPKGKA